MKVIIKEKKYKKIILFSIFFICFLISFVSADSVGTSDMTEGKVVYTSPLFVNYSLVPTVNSSNYWDDLNTPVDLLLSMFSATWIDATLDMNNNIIENVLNLFAVGNVTIGENLDVDGNITLGGVINGVNISNLSNEYVPYTGADKNVNLGNNNFTVNGTTFHVDSNKGRVGIGTTSPTSQLTLAGTTGMDINPGSDVNAELITVGVTGAPTLRWSESNDYFSFSKSLRTAASMFAGIYYDKNDLSYYLHPDSTGTALSIAGTALIGGKVGIGTTAPTSSLMVNSSNGYGGFEVTNSSGSSRFFVNASNGNVGIGTTGPLHNFAVGTIQHVTPYGTVGFKSDSQSIAVYIEETGSGAESWGIGVQTDGDLHFYNSGNTDNNIEVTFQDDGNVGIGTANPTHELNVNGSVNITGDLIIEGNQTLGQKITFALGEIIDNIVDGWIRITGNLNVTGNVTAENVFIPQYIFSHTNATIPVRTANNWTNITFDQEDTDVKSGISHTYNDATNHTFTIMEDGIYNVDYDLDVEDNSGTPSTIDVAGRLILENGTEVLGSVFEIDITKQGAEAELSHNFLVACNAGDVLVFQFIATDADVQISTHGTFGDHPESATILINKIANLP